MSGPNPVLTETVLYSFPRYSHYSTSRHFYIHRHSTG